MISRLHAFSGIRARQRPADRRQPGKSSLGRCAKNKGLSPSNAICPAYQKTGQPPWVARFLMVWVYSYGNISAVTLAFYWPLHSIHSLLPVAHCSLHIANYSIRPQKKFPGAGPRAYCICNTVCIDGGLCRGKVSPGEAWRDRPLLKRRVPPRSSLSVGILRGGALQGLLPLRDLSFILAGGR